MLSNLIAIVYVYPFIYLLKDATHEDVAVVILDNFIAKFFKKKLFAPGRSKEPVSWLGCLANRFN